jgi:hypothetical protein
LVTKEVGNHHAAAPPTALPTGPLSGGPASTWQPRRVIEQIHQAHVGGDDPEKVRTPNRHMVKARIDKKITAGAALCPRQRWTYSLSPVAA